MLPIPSVAQIDELQTFVGNKKNKIWLWTVVNKGSAGILAWTIGDRSAETFKPLWKIIKGWKCFFYPTFRRYLDKFNSFKLGGIKPWNQYIATVSSIAKSI